MRLPKNSLLPNISAGVNIESWGPKSRCHSEHPESEHLEDLAVLSKALEDEVDRMSSPSVQIELSISRELGSGPTEILMYSFWCHIVLYLVQDKAILVRVNSEGRVCPFGEPKPARVHKAKQSGGGLILCVGWNWGADTVQAYDPESLKILGTDNATGKQDLRVDICVYRHHSASICCQVVLDGVGPAVVPD